MIKYLLSWTAPEGQTAKADLDGLVVDSNDPMVCNTWWGASVLAAKIAYGNESLTKRVADAAELVEVNAQTGPVTVNGWTFTISDVRYNA
jgi:hypothetical protein